MVNLGNKKQVTQLELILNRNEYRIYTSMLLKLGTHRQEQKQTLYEHRKRRNEFSGTGDEL